MGKSFDYLVIGGGMAADSAAKSLHDNDPDASVGILGNEQHPPYRRPLLSKGLWQDSRPAEQVVDLRTTSSGAEVRTDCHIVNLNPDDRTVEDDRGERWHYQRLLLATGASPRRLPLAEHSRVIHFRSLADYQALRELASPGAHVVVVGGGFIGSELASALTGSDCRVTMIFLDDNIGAQRFPDTLAEFLSDYYRSNGVDIRSGVKVISGEARDDGVTLSLSDSTELEADVVVAGLGVTPNTQLAANAGLSVDDGVLVDEQLRTSDPNIWAAGDVANFYSQDLAQRLRIEHENAAITMGNLAGENMAGGRRTYKTLPFFYSDMFSLGFEAVGIIDNRMEMVEDWQMPFQEGVIYYLDTGRVCGILLWNIWGQVDAARELIAQPGPFDMESLRGRIPSFM